MTYNVTTGPSQTGTGQGAGTGSAGGGPSAAAPGNTAFSDSGGWGIATNSVQRFYIDNNGNVALTNSPQLSIGGNLAVAGTTALSGPVTLAHGATITNDAISNPNGNLTANPGSLLLNSGGGFGQAVWIKELGLDNQGWTALAQSTVYATCASGVVAGTCVYLTLSGGNYTATVATPDALDTKPAHGVVVNAYGTTCQVALSGTAHSGGVALTVNQPVYVGAGGVPTSDPTTLSKPFFVQAIGYAVASDSFQVEATPPSYYSGVP